MPIDPLNVPLVIDSLRSGFNGTDSATAIEDDACQLAENVDFYTSMLGQRRLGCTAVTLGAALVADTNQTTVTWMGRHLPTSDYGDAELWVLGQSLTTATNLLQRRTKTAWSTVTPTDAITSYPPPYGHYIVGLTRSQKFFVAYKSAQLRLHVWDGTTLRRAGVAQPAAPSVADTGAGTYSGTRYFRIRFVELSGTTVLRRSEPSATTTFVPSGAGLSARITKPATVSEGETHWEVEASNNNVDFYRITRVVVGTTTYDDSTAASPGYASVSGAVLSEAIGAYTLIPSGQYLTADDDRLLVGGDYETGDYASRVWWTPVRSDAGVGNDERVDLNNNPFVDLDGLDGGGLTGLSRVTTGYVYAFKRSRIYRLRRTGVLLRAYEPICLTQARGALKGSVVEAIDQSGEASLYFLDPSVGACRQGRSGLEWCGYDALSIWRRVNVDATIPCRVEYFADKQQVHWWVAIDGSSYPNAKIILQVNRVVRTEQGVRRGWTTVPAGNRIADVHSTVMFSVNVDSTDARSVSLVPLIGKTQWTVGSTTVRDLVQRCEVGHRDAFTTGDTTAYYRGKVRTKPYTPGGLLNRFGILAGCLLAKANASAQLSVRLIKDYETEPTVDVDVNLTPQGVERSVIRTLDNLGLSELQALEVEFGDLRPDLNYNTQWDIERMTFKVSAGSST